tara:strand:- start:614 stop:805 length:192 start_codon:yes stop_codon:yes gene_type:complete
MKDLLNKIFALNGLRFLAILTIVLSIILIFAPVQNTTGGGITLFLGMVAFALLARKKYNSNNK